MRIVPAILTYVAVRLSSGGCGGGRVGLVPGGVCREAPSWSEALRSKEQAKSKAAYAAHIRRQVWQARGRARKRPVLGGPRARGGGVNVCVTSWLGCDWAGSV